MIARLFWVEHGPGSRKGEEDGAIEAGWRVEDGVCDEDGAFAGPARRAKWKFWRELDWRGTCQDLRGQGPDSAINVTRHLQPSV
jgi:hypothetical protein